MADTDDDAVRKLYATPPEEFLAARAELVKQARQDGDAKRAAELQKLRKPTTAAWIVNAFALHEPAVVGELTDLGNRLRAAQDALDAERMRDLSSERRRLVAKLSKAAFERAGRRSPPMGLRDEVTGTLDAAIADPDIARRLGQLPRAEQWSGFGFATGGGTPELTLVRGGRDTGRRKPAGPHDAEPEAAGRKKPSAAERRRQQRLIAQTRDAFDSAESAYHDAVDTERDQSEQVRKLTKKLSKLQTELEGAREGLELARTKIAETKTARRQARLALDKAERDRIE